MNRFKNILYVLDALSPGGKGSADKVAGLARINEARVTIMFAEEIGFFDDLSRQLTGRHEELRRALVEDNRKNLDNFIHHERWQGIAVKPRYGLSNDFIAIIREVVRESFDLVIKESTLKQGIDQLSMRMVRKCPCPVWVIKRDASDFRRILAAVDVGSRYPETAALNKKIIELAHSLAQRGGGEAHYLHGWRLEYEGMLSSPRFRVSPEEIFEMKQDLFSNRQADLIKLLNDNHILYEERQVHVREGMSSEVISQTINTLDIDVVVMGSVGRSGIPGLLIGNMAEKLLNIINCSVLTVKPDGFESPVKLN